MLLAAMVRCAVCSGGLYYSGAHDDCFTPEQCEEKHMYAYPKLMMCTNAFSPAEDGDFETSTGNVYACKKDWYTVFDWSVIRCVASAEQCVNLYVSTETKTCMRNPNNCKPLFYTF